MPELIAGTLVSAATITPEQVKAVAVEVATNLLAQKDAEKAVAAKIETLTNDANTSRAELAKAVANVAGLQAQIDGFTKQVATLTAEKTSAITKLAETEAAKAGLQAVINKAVADKAIATRTDSLTKVGASKEVATQYTALNEDGTLKVSDESFTQTLAVLNSAFAAGKASMAPATSTTPAAAVVPVVPAQATGSVTPIAPDLTHVDQFAQATAALMNGGGLAPTVSGRAAYAAAFKD